jgi:small subunit ribosomal protein S13
MLILGTRCDTEKALNVSLQAIYGINAASANHICALIGVAPRVKLKDLRQRRLDNLNKVCRDLIPSSLYRYRQDNVKALIDIKHYRGVRHMFGLPCHGQRTRTNASTAKRYAQVQNRARRQRV